jgi:hypothetical protein
MSLLQKIKKSLAALLIGTALWTSLSGPAHADMFEGLDTVAEAELEDARGGFLSAGGVSFNFGAVVKTFADGQLALSTQLNWTDQGPMAAHSVTEAYAGPNQAAALAALALGSIDGGQAVVINNGQTAIIHRIDSGTVQNLILNAAADQVFAQTIDITLTLPGFDATQQQIGLDLLGLRLNSEINAALADYGGG